MGLKERDIYKLIISRLDGEKIGDRLYRKRIESLVEKGIGGFILFGGERKRIKGFIEHIQALSDTELFFGADIETGLSSVIEDGGYFPKQMAVAAAFKGERNYSLIEKALRVLASETKTCGLNMAFIPVLDVNKNIRNPIICTRAFSDDPELVGYLGSIYIKILESQGIVCCAKHFPGHGDTHVDSHKRLPTIKKSAEELFSVDIYPFRKAIEAGVSSIMVGHLKVPSIDRKPASLSKSVVEGILRERLGFDGIVLTDALTMGALRKKKNVLSLALNAGCDLLLHPFDPEDAVKELIGYIEKGKVEERKIERTIERIKRLKKAKSEIEKFEFCLDEDPIGQIVESSITLVNGKEFNLSLHDFSILFYGIEKFKDRSPLRHCFKEWSGEKGNVIVTIFTENRAKSEAFDLKASDIEKIRKIIRKAACSVVVSFGNPYVLRHFGDANFLIAAYDTHETVQISLIRALKGEIQFRGRLPVSGIKD